MEKRRHDVNVECGARARVCVCVCEGEGRGSGATTEECETVCLAGCEIRGHSEASNEDRDTSGGRWSLRHEVETAV
jgi:hypothetical protein